MNRLLLVILVVLILGSAGFGVAQLGEIKKLQQNLAALGQERTALQKRLWDLQKQNGELENRRNRATDPAAATAAEGERAGEPPAGNEGPPGNPRVRDRNEGNRLANILARPEVQQLMAVQQKAALDGRYSSLFKQLNLSPADLEKFKGLLVEKQSAAMDVMAAVRAEGLDGRENRDQIRQLVQDTQTELDNTLRSTLGEAGFAQYQNYEATQPQRSVVSQLEQRLSYSTTTLTASQSEQLVQILTQTAPPSSNANRNPMAAGFVQAFVGRGGAINALTGGTTPISNEAITQARTVLSTQQVSALQNLQQEQQATTQLMQQMRGNLEGWNRGANTPSGATAPAETATTPPRPPAPGGG
ncbi:MAG: hypothetical protein EXS42_01855 [Lacunisphaera sp.]|nr:hypothetical protein [Lacunisphaera sp.]